MNFDLKIDSGDIGYLLSHWGARSGQNADVNLDDVVNGVDLACIPGYFGSAADDTFAH